jgi:large repetitive protein
MRPGINIRLNRVYGVICRSFLILFVAIIGISSMFSSGRILVSSASPQEQASVRFESALRQQRQSARLLMRSSSAESRFQRLSAKAIESGVVPVIATLRVAYSPQVEVRGEVESQAQRFEIGRMREGILDELVGYDPASIKEYDELPIVGLRVNASGIESLRQSDNILDIQEDRLHRTSLAQSVPFIGGTNAWASGFTGAGQTVAVLDTGVDKNHPMLAGKVVSEACYSTTYASPPDYYSSISVCPGGASSSTAANSGLPCPTDCEHGTHVAGIAAGKTVTYNGESFSGVAKDANVIAIQVFSRFTFDHDDYCGGPGTAPCTGVSAYTSDIIRGLERVYSLRSTYSIASANMSLGGGQFFSNCDSYDAATKAVIDLLRAANIATVVASGNERFTDSLASPACISTAVSVGATLDSANTVASYSNSASFLSLLAPGSGITSAVPGSGYGTWNGTSMATPHVAGAWAIAKQKSPSASVTTILSALQSSGVSVTDTRNGIVKPRIAIDLALARLVAPALPTAPTTLAATAFSSTRINLTWVDTSTSETNFILQRKTGVAGTWTTIASPAANLTSYQDNAVVASTAYYYRISATNSIGTSATSSEATATTFGPTAVPTGVAATVISASQVNLIWTDEATNETGYRIERRQTTGTTTAFSLLVNLGAGVTSYSNTGLTAATGYAYRVSAVAPGGALVSASEVTATTAAVTAPPTLFTATPISKSQINLSWTDAAANEIGYQVERRLTSATVWGTPVPLAAGATAYSDTTGLVPATSYTYRVSAIAPGGALVSAAPIAATTFAATAVPTGVTATAFSSTQINLSWTDAATNETGYKIERRLTSDTVWTVVATPAINATAYSNTGLTDTTGYTYRVSAVAPGGDLVSAAEVAATTFAPTAAPTGVAATAFSATQINLSWSDNATNETGYRISRRLTSVTAWTDLATIAANATSYNSTGLTAATGYAYRVSAVAPGGALVSASEVTATTFAVTAAPTAFTATAISKSQINLRWTDAAANEIGYQVERRLTSATVWGAAVPLAAGVSTYSDTTGLAAATSYTYRVSAIAPGGAMVSAATIAATTFAATAVPTGVTATAFSSTQINLKWTDAATNEINYKIERRLTSDTSGAWGDVATLPANTTAYNNTALTDTTGYTYRVSAVAPGGDLVSAADVSATTFAPTASPTGVAATAFSATQINLSWSDNATNETGYRIERRQTTGSGATTTFSLVVNLGAGVTSYSNPGLAAATGYAYRVSAIAPGGALVSASEVTATTFAVTAAPTAFTATAISKSQINLRWTDAAANEIGYQVERRLTSATVWGAAVPLAAGVSTYSDTTGLAAATSYTYRVSAIAPGGAMVSAATIAATTFAATAVPTGVTATAFSSTQINLKWTDAATNEINYKIERRLTSDTSGAWGDVATLPANTTAYNNTALTDTTGYTYRVSAVAPGGDLVSAAEVAATTFAPTAAPTGVVATAFSATQINLSWSDNATNETGYRISRRLTSVTAWTDLATIAANATSYNSTGLTAATGYAYRVSAVAPGGALVSASEVTATTFAVTAAPTAFTATAISKSQINLRWTDAAANEIGYQVERRLTSATVWGAAVPLAAGVSTYSDTTGLAVATSYTYRVSAIAPGGALVSAAPIAATTFAATAVPTGVTATAFSSTQINLKWTDAATNEINYKIERRLTSDTVWGDVVSLPANTTAYSNTALADATGYTYRVSAVAPGGDLVSAAEVAATTFAPTAAPTGVAATAVSASRIDLSWTDAAMNETGYRIERRQTTGSGATTTFSLVVNLGAGVTSYSNPGLAAATGYAYRVSAIAPGGALVSASEVTATTAAVTAAPTLFAATPISKSQIRLNWTDAATNETGYQVERRLTSATVWGTAVPLGAGATTYSDTTGLAAATSYTYRVSAIAPGGALVSAAPVTATTFGVTAVPTGVTATAFSSTQINLKWNDAATNETGYKIERRLTSDTSGAWGDVANLPANTTAYSNTGLTDTTGYTYRVSAVAPGGDLVSAAPVAAATFAPTAAPTGVVTTVISATQINLSWTDAATNETGYRISRRLTAGTAWTDLATLPANTTTYNNTGLTAGTGYTYKVSAVAPGGALVNSSEFATTTAAK